MDLRLYTLEEDDFPRILALGNKIYGDNYLSIPALETTFIKSKIKKRCCSFVLYDGVRAKNNLVGFRLTYAPGNWEADAWCSPESWGVPIEKLCYFKTNTVDPHYQGKGLGSYLLDASKCATRSLGAVAGIAHIWLQSPNNSAFKYFTKNGGELIAVWQNKWTEDARVKGTICSVCGQHCVCSAAEMILHFGE